MNKYLGLLCVGTSAAAMLAGSASADYVVGDTIALQFQGSNPRLEVFTSYVEGDSSSAVNRGPGAYSLAGRLNWMDSNFITFCIQIGEDVEYGDDIEYTFETLETTPDDPPYAGGMGEMRGIMVRDLYSRWYKRVSEAENDAEGQALSGAFQIMIWEITHESLTGSASGQPLDSTVSQLDIELGAMQTNGANAEAAGIFAEMKASLGQGGWLDAYGDNLWGLSNPTYQDQILVVPGAAVGMAGLGFFGARRRRQR